jgi:hypothetical protein
MGDRSNIKVVYPSGNAVYLYGHWMGEDNRRIVVEALKEGRRLDDPAYFTRILFSKMLANWDNQVLTGESGFGISDFVQDNEYPIAVVDFKKSPARTPLFYMEDEDGTFIEYAGGFEEESW